MAAAATTATTATATAAAPIPVHSFLRFASTLKRIEMIFSFRFVSRFLLDLFVNKSESGETPIGQRLLPVVRAYISGPRRARVTHVNYTSRKNRYPVALICRARFSPTLSNSPSQSPRFWPPFPPLTRQPPSLSLSLCFSKQKTLSSACFEGGKKSIRSNRWR